MTYSEMLKQNGYKWCAWRVADGLLQTTAAERMELIEHWKLDNCPEVMGLSEPTGLGNFVQTF